MSDSSRVSTSNSYSSGIVAHEPAPHWQQGCYSKFSKGICTVADCPYIHELSPAEISKLLIWKQQDQQHLVFNSRSNTNSNADSSRESKSTAGSTDAWPKGSVEEIIETARATPNMGPKRQQLIRKMKEHFSDIDDDELRKLLPTDENGEDTSIGGLLHESGRCRPCRYMLSRTECIKGLRCGFCHFPHDTVPASVVDFDMADRRRASARPCKTARDKYRKHADRIERSIREDPWNFDPKSVYFPPNIFEGRPELKSKFLMRLSAQVDVAKAEALGGDASGHSRGNMAASRGAASSGASGAASSGAQPASSHEAVRRNPSRIVQL